MRRSRPALGLASLLGAVLVGCGPSGASAALTGGHSPGCPAPSADTPGARESHLPVRALCALPPQAVGLLREIQIGAPTGYSRDGIIFGNAARLLPRHARGYYHEYTVPTPGSADRGARRLVIGRGWELYYSGDHYRSFVVVDPRAARR